MVPALIGALIVVIAGATVAIVMTMRAGSDNIVILNAGTVKEMKAALTAMEMALEREREARDAVAEITALKTRACKCKETKCAERVQEEFGIFLEKHKDTKGSSELAERVGTVFSEMSECLARVALGVD